MLPTAFQEQEEVKQYRKLMLQDEDEEIIRRGLTETREVFPVP